MRSIFYYQGQAMAGTRINYMGECLTVAPGEDLIGDENIYRDALGRYYIERTLLFLRGERRASGRTLVHRLSVKAAALWAVMRANCESPELRREVAAALESPSPTTARRQHQPRGGHQPSNDHGYRAGCSDVALVAAAMPTGDDDEEPPKP